MHTLFYESILLRKYALHALFAIKHKEAHPSARPAVRVPHSPFRSPTTMIPERYRPQAGHSSTSVEPQKIISCRRPVPSPYCRQTWCPKLRFRYQLPRLTHERKYRGLRIRNLIAQRKMRDWTPSMVGTCKRKRMIKSFSVSSASGQSTTIICRRLGPCARSPTKL